jgi:sulfur carrier protein ThiS
MRNMQVKIGELTKPLKSVESVPGVSLETFLDRRGMGYDATIRVNGKVTAKTAILKNGDIITIIGHFNGGC